MNVYANRIDREKKNDNLDEDYDSLTIQIRSEQEMWHRPITMEHICVSFVRCTC